jgi:histidyl-tRNA synthetase
LGETAERRLFGLVTELRRAGLSADLATGRGLKGAMKAADRSRADYALILGDRDLALGVAQLKDLHTGKQTPVPLDGLVAELVHRVGNDPG